MMNQYLRYWDERRGKITAKKGGWMEGKGVVTHGYSLLDDLLGKISFFQLLVLHVRGQLPERRLSEWIEAAFMCLSWPDARIWCNQIGALGGNARVSPTSAVCAGSLSADSRIFGVGTLVYAFDFIAKGKQFVDRGGSIEEYICQYGQKDGELKAPGFARPVAKGDERVDAMQELVKELGFEEGGYVELAYEMNNYIIDNYGESLNFAGYVVAFLADQGFTSDEITRLFSLWVNGGVHACYTETTDMPPGSFFPMQCVDIMYVGKEHRPVPERSERESGA